MATTTAISTTQKSTPAVSPDEDNKKQNLHRRRYGKRHVLFYLVSTIILTFVCLSRMHNIHNDAISNGGGDHVNIININNMSSSNVDSISNNNNTSDSNNNSNSYYTYSTTGSRSIETMEKVANSLFEMAANIVKSNEVSRSEIADITKNVHDLNEFIRENLREIREKLPINARGTPMIRLGDEFPASSPTKEKTTNQIKITPTKKEKKETTKLKLGVKVAIFFNTFQKPYDTERANQIIVDQLQKVNAQQLLQNSTIYYSRFGDYTTNPFPLSTCENDNHRKCVQFAAEDDGDEKDTLQYLYDYCIANKNDTAVYIHTKGAYTPSDENDLLRDILMEAVTSEECLDIDTSSCNTCSTQFHGVPSHYPGNMWVAQCDYVSKLIPPNEFEGKKHNILQMVKDSTNAIENSNFFETKFNDGTSFKFHKSKLWMLESESMLGINRFAMEQWIGSHPDMTPCEVFSPKDGVPIFRYGTIEEKGLNAATLTPVQHLAPGVNFKEFWQEKSFKLHPLFRKPGRIFDYNVLYSKEPVETSWFYSFWDN